MWASYPSHNVLHGYSDNVTSNNTEENICIVTWKEKKYSVLQDYDHIPKLYWFLNYVFLQKKVANLYYKALVLTCMASANI